MKRPLFVGSLLFCAAAAVAHAQTADEINKWFKYTPPVFEGRMPVDQAASSSSSSEKPVTTLQVQPSSSSSSIDQKPTGDPTGGGSGGGTTQPIESSSSSSVTTSTRPPPNRTSSKASSSISSKSSSRSSSEAVKSSSSSHSSIASSSSSSSASSESSSSSSAEVIPLTTGTEECHFSLFDPGSYVRDCYGYNVPVIDPASIAHLEEVSRSGDVIGTNILLSLLFTIVIGLSGLVFAFLSRLAPELLHRVLRRLPLQLVITLLLIWLWNVFVPAASAQGLTAASGVSLLSLPLYAFLFFLVIGVSNFIFNNIVTSEGDAIHEFIVSHPLLDRIIGGGKRLSHEKWLVLLLIFAYGIVGAYINPQFSLFPSHQVGIVLVTVIAIILSAYFKDFMRFLLARSWKCNAWFKANVGGLVVSVTCVLLSRHLGLSPGYIYGVPVGLFIVSALYTQHEGRFEFIGLLWLILLGIVVWLVTPFAAGYQVPTDILNLLFVLAVEHAFIELLPLPFLAGSTIFRWKKFLWAAEFLVITFLLFHTFINPKGTVYSLEQSPPTMTTLMLLACYAGGVFVLWAYIVWSKRKAP